MVVFYYMGIKNANGSRKGCKNRISTKIKQSKVLAKIIEDGRPLAVAMREVGYKEGYKPTTLIKTKTWEELLERDLPDKLLSKVAKQGLKAKGGDKYKDLEIRHKYLETSLKMKGKLRDNTDAGSMVGLVVGFKMLPPKDRGEVIEGEEVT